MRLRNIVLVGVIMWTVQARAEWYHEVSGNVNFYLETGTSNSSTSTEKEKADQKNVVVSGMYGMFMDNGFEPFFEAQYNSESFGLKDYVSRLAKIGLGFGVLFNMPFDLSGGGKEKKDPHRTGVLQAHLIPYGGLMVGYDNENGSIKRQDAATETTKDANITTKFMVGCRYRILENVFTNSSVRASYQTVENKVDSQGGKSTRLTIDLRLLGLSLIF